MFDKKKLVIFIVCLFVFYVVWRLVFTSLLLFLRTGWSVSTMYTEVTFVPDVTR